MGSIGYQWCPLATERQVGAAEVGDAVDAGAFRDDIGIADLQRERPLRAWPMANGLAMAADGVVTVKSAHSVPDTAAKLVSVLEEKGMTLDAVIELKVDQNRLLARIENRVREAEAAARKSNVTVDWVHADPAHDPLPPGPFDLVMQYTYLVYPLWDPHYGEKFANPHPNAMILLGILVVRGITLDGAAEGLETLFADAGGGLSGRRRLTQRRQHRGHASSNVGT